jgi:hypothetical protein
VQGLQVGGRQGLPGLRAQELAEQRVEGVDRHRAFAPFGEQAAAGQVGQQIAGAGMAADGHGHRHAGIGQVGDAHQRLGVGRVHAGQHLAGEEGKQVFTRRAAAQGIGQA